MRNRLSVLRKRIVNTFGNLTLKRKYLLSHGSVVLLTAALISPSSYFIARSQLERRSLEYSSIILQKSSYIWDMKLTEIIDYFIVQFDAREVFQDLKDFRFENPSLSKLRIEKSLADILTYKSGIRLLLIDSRDGQRYFKQKSGSVYSPEDIGSYVPYQEVVSLRAKPFIQTLQDGTILFSKVLYDIESTEFLGILTVGYDPDVFVTVFPEPGNTALGRILIVDNLFGSPVVYSKEASGILPFLPGRSVYEGAPLPDALGKRYLLNEIQSEDGRWLFQSYIAINELTQVSTSAGSYIFLATFFALLAALILSVVLAGKETRRIFQIKDHAQSIASGDLSHKYKDTFQDELGQLSYAIEDLSDRISGLVDNLASEKVRLEEVRYSALQSEYNALQSKINPHFLYNTLEMVNAMAKLKGHMDIAETIQLLAELLRESLKRKNAQILLKEELEYISRYLKIQQILHDDNLIITMKVPEDCLGCLVPNFILQPVIENAIIHGIEPSVETGRIEIAATKEGESLVLSVEDNGIGISEQNLKNLLDRKAEGSEGLKIGVSSIQRRIHILFGENFGVGINSAPGKGTSVIIKIPFIQEFSG